MSSGPRGRQAESATRARAFGLSLRTDLALPGRWSAAPGAEADVVLVEEPFPVPEEPGDLGWSGMVDGTRFTARYAADALVMEHAGVGTWMLDAGRSRLSMQRESPGDVGVLRTLLDSVLFTCALERGGEALHAGAVLLEDGVVAIAGPSGAGKSSLLAALLESGARFFSDDVLFVAAHDGRLVAEPGPPLMTVAGGALPAGSDLVADLGDEQWVGVDQWPRREPLIGLVVLGPAGTAAPGWKLVLGQLLNFPSTAERQGRRFMLAADLARLPVVRMTARERPPSELAVSVLEAFGAGVAA